MNESSSMACIFAAYACILPCMLPSRPASVCVVPPSLSPLGMFPDKTPVSACRDTFPRRRRQGARHFTDVPHNTEKEDRYDTLRCHTLRYAPLPSCWLIAVGDSSSRQTTHTHEQQRKCRQEGS
mmetsp:Transcript_49096/g.123067  ORF Transcript_49096/g.123067 Transcript_49096/m.123067 type:complete len:124 (+) Transcript_49096:530-901(+)